MKDLKINFLLPFSELQTDLAKLTSQPGVYRMMDKSAVVLYVGKASNLKKRVGSYFNKPSLSAKTRSLVGQIAAIDITVTRTETEALLLESTLIKQLRPKYNVLMRDDKSYPYIYVSDHPAFPRMEIVRMKRKPTKGMYFGPYPSAGAVRETLTIIQRVFKIRSCKDSYFAARSRPCLQYQIKRCTAPCTAYISPENYQLALKDAIRFLQGKSQQIVDDLAKRMEAAVNHLEFEEAATIRDQIKRLRLVQEQQSVTQLQGDVDVLAMEVRLGFACILCVSVRAGEVQGSQSFFPIVPLLLEEEFSLDELHQQVLEAFINFYYLEQPERIPATIVLDKATSSVKPLAELLSKLRGKRCQLVVKPRGIKARWLELAKTNLQVSVARELGSKMTVSARYQALAALLNLNEPIKRLECFDISHTQGASTVASCVVFDSEGPSPKNYRRFNIKEVKAGDDYAAMEQVIRRRFKRLSQEGQTLPQIIIIDGGKGQVGVAKQVLEELAIDKVLILGIAKGEGRKPAYDKLIHVKEDRLIHLPETSPALHLIQHIRDEAHRFAISFHRKKRQTSSLESTLESLEGVGQKRRQALLQRFGGLRELMKAPAEEIAKVKGISATLAERIFQHFHPLP